MPNQQSPLVSDPGTTSGTPPVRRFLPGWQIRVGGIELFRPYSVVIVRYRYRRTKIPTPWASAPTRIAAPVA
jgi:RNA-directed DNA polymerase